VLDARLRIIDHNLAAASLFKESFSELVGKDASTVFGNYREIMDFFLDEEEFMEYLSPYTDKWYEIRLEALQDREKQPAGKLLQIRDVTERKKTELEKEEAIRDLREALDQVKTLKDLLPICANCKNIRDDSGYWHRVEHYFSEHLDTSFSHGICPSCAEKLYPEVFEMDKKGENEEL